MGKAPAFQFYVRDWLSDPELRLASASSRGIWADCLAYMWEARERGKLVIDRAQMARFGSCTEREAEVFLDEAQRYRFADVTICNNEVTIINRRMYREQKQREQTRLRVRRLRSNKPCNADVTPPSSSSSSSSPSKKDKPKGLSPSSPAVDDAAWTQFWNAYPRKVAKEAARKKWRAMKVGNGTRQAILSDISRRVASGEWDKARMEYIPHPATYLNQRRWEDETKGSHDPYAFLREEQRG